MYCAQCSFTEMKTTFIKLQNEPLLKDIVLYRLESVTLKAMFDLGKKLRFPFIFLFMKSKGANLV